MIDVLQTAAAWLEGRRASHMSGLVHYLRGAERIVLAATIAHSDHERIDAAGIVETVRTTDFLVPTANLVLAGEPIVPERGDRIEREDAAERTTQIYEVLAPAGGVVYRTENRGQTLRIHTKRLDAEATP